jgi:hypothetical protein
MQPRDAEDLRLLAHGHAVSVPSTVTVPCAAFSARLVKPRLGALSVSDSRGPAADALLERGWTKLVIER